jgi:L-lactate dehydrogenase (cytochrome)
VLRDVAHPDLSRDLLGQRCHLPFALGPVGLAGLYARRGEVQAMRAAAQAGIPFALSTVSLCPIEEVAQQAHGRLWFQLYVLRDRGFMRDALARAQAAGVNTLVFTVDLPVPGARYRDAHSGMSGPRRGLRRLWQACTHPRWAWDVGVRGRPHDLGTISAYLGMRVGLGDYIGWLGENFDPSIGWSDLEWIRDTWTGPLLIKGILDPDDARDARRFGADGIVVSNHGGRQLDGAPSTASVLPRIVDAVKGELAILVDSGLRNGVDVARALALGADAALLGRAWLYALAAGGEAGVRQLIQLVAKELQVTMMLAGVRTLRELDRDCLA